MRLYIDKENIESFVRSAALEPTDFEQCNLMLKRHFDMHLNVSKEVFASSQFCMDWATTLLDGRGENLIHFDAPASIFPKRPIAANTFGDAFDENTADAVYLLNDEEMTKIEQQGNFLAAGVGKELETLKQLRIGDDEEPYYQILSLREHFEQGEWKGLDGFLLPCSDIILSDPYIVSNPDLYSKNLVALLLKITEKVISKVNIVIFCLSETSYNQQGITPNWNSVRKKIKDELSQVYRDANITFVAYNPSYEIKEHDRTIFTNYLYIMSGPSFNFYNSNGNFTTHGRHLVVNSLAKSNHHTVAKNYLKDMQRIINEITNDNTLGIINKDAGQKLSNFLTFP